MWLLNQGARVVLVSRELPDLIKIGQDFPSQAICIQCDISKSSDHEDMVSSALEVLGGLDILINAAGVLYENDLEHSCPREHDYLINLNLKATFNIIKLCTPSLRKSKGMVVNLSSVWGLRPQQGMVSFCISKSGVQMLTKCLALELAPVRVNAVAPGMVKSKFLEKNFKAEEVTQIKKNYLKKNPFHKLARVDDIVKAIVFLSHRKSCKVTGETLVVDGGFSITSSIFTHWDGIRDMNSTIAPSGANGKTLMKNFVEGFIGFFKKDQGEGVRDVVGKSNWSTNLADAHFKITDNYNKIEGEDHILDDLRKKKDNEGQIYTYEHPKPARFVGKK
jgi:NAD(P)-dependent dehydrogenase (short-subunit alcohol dehydrogenase family)